MINETTFSSEELSPSEIVHLAVNKKPRDRRHLQRYFDINGKLKPTTMDWSLACTKMELLGSLMSSSDHA